MWSSSTILQHLITSFQTEQQKNYNQDKYNHFKLLSYFE